MNTDHRKHVTITSTKYLLIPPSVIEHKYMYCLLHITEDRELYIECFEQSKCKKCVKIIRCKSQKKFQISLSSFLSDNGVFIDEIKGRYAINPYYDHELFGTGYKIELALNQHLFLINNFIYGRRGKNAVQRKKDYDKC